MKYYCVDKSGRHGSASLCAGAKYAVYDAKGNRLEDSAFVFEKKPSLERSPCRAEVDRRWP